MRNTAFVFSHIFAIAFALLTALWSWWLPWKAENSESRIKSVLVESWLNLKTPIPWLGVVIVGWGYAVYRSEQFSRQLGDYATLEDSYDLLDRDYSDETEAHRDTMHSYYESLRSSLKYILTSGKTGFSETCRVTVYRVHEADRTVFRNIFRHAGQFQFDANGRDVIPINQGVVGLAFATAGVRSFSSSAAFDTDEYWSELEQCLLEASLSMPPKNVRMKSVHLVAKAISDHSTGKQVGVVAYESIAQGHLDEQGITEHLTDEDQNISRFVSHLAKLDADLNPFPHDAYFGMGDLDE